MAPNTKAVLAYQIQAFGAVIMLVGLVSGPIASRFIPVETWAPFWITSTVLALGMVVGGIGRAVLESSRQQRRDSSARRDGDA